MSTARYSDLEAWGEIDSAATKSLPSRRWVRSDNTESIAVIPITSDAARVMTAVRKVSKLMALPDNWDGAGAQRPNAVACAFAIEAIRALDEAGLEATDIDPSVENGICLSFLRGDKYAHIECFNDGEVVGVISTLHGDAQIWEVDGSSVRGWKAATKQLSQFLNR